MAHDYDRRGAGAVVVGIDHAPGGGHHRKAVEEVAGNVLALGKFGLAVDTQVETADLLIREKAGQSRRRHLVKSLERWKREDRGGDPAAVAVGPAVDRVQHEFARAG